MASTESISTHEKAVQINLEPTVFGSFAEIGAGQEVARWFLVVGGGSGTVAKSISAYDKEVSDDLYGSGSRYVSRERLQAMLDAEWTQLVGQLNRSRGPQTRFFCFVDTVAARNYAGTNEPHGWVGLRFQLEPGGQPNDLLLHINMRDSSTILQQEAVGILGVNLIYAVFYQLEAKQLFFENVAQDVQGRLEFDYVSLRGHAFERWDQRSLLVHLVRAGLAEAVCFTSKGSPEPPVEVLYKRAVVLAPVSIEELNRLDYEAHKAQLEAGIQQLQRELEERGPTPVALFGLSATPLMTDYELSEPDLLDRVKTLLACGGDVLIFREPELYAMSDLVNRYTREHVRFVVGLPLLIRVFEHRYNKLRGDLLEALSRLLARNVRIYAQPMPSDDLDRLLQSISASGWTWCATDGWVSASQLRLRPPLGHLYEYVLASKFLFPLLPVAAWGDIVTPVK